MKNNIKLRDVIVKSYENKQYKGWFHKFITTKMGEHCALVEFEDGSLSVININKILFVNRPESIKPE